MNEKTDDDDDLHCVLNYYAMRNSVGVYLAGWLVWAGVGWAGSERAGWIRFWIFCHSVLYGEWLGGKAVRLSIHPHVCLQSGRQSVVPRALRTTYEGVHTHLHQV